MRTVWRATVVVLVTWGILIVLLLAPAPLPETWRYRIYSPASVGLWFLAMLLTPFVTVYLRWPWIRNPRRRRA
ncbi:hypothetical protein ACFWXK_10725 [Streptomyces sp. NPDC059070]|uniref:hypothetical protein n=1 Tax=Streptomyces sp. NPDC059070 TaxID=3346713 RepID=UPI0036D0EA8C